MNKRDLTSITDLSHQEISNLLERAKEIRNGANSLSLTGKSIALLFEKPSLRTRLSFEVAVSLLGGHSIYLGPDEVGLGVREPTADVARILERQVDIVVSRTFTHSTIKELAHWARIPVVNALSDLEHPCQALTDLLTVWDHIGCIRGITIAFIGDGNNVATSLALAATALGANFLIASPNEYQLPKDVIKRVENIAQQTSASFLQIKDPNEAAQKADVIYTDVWTSMGQEDEAHTRKVAFQGYQVNNALMSLAHPNAIFMHDLPAHQGEEIATGMLEHPQSVVFDQAANKLHVVQAVLELVLPPKHVSKTQR